MRLSLRNARRATATAMATSVAVVGLLSSACAPVVQPGSKVISGTIKGADGRIVDVLIGYDVVDAAGHKMNLGGGNVGYSAIQRLNYCVPTNGAAAPQTCWDGTTAKKTGIHWSLRVPGNAVKVYIEVYPKAPTGTDWLNNYRGYTGVAAGSTNVSTYSTVYKSAISMTGNVGGVNIVVPKVCSAGGTTGTLQGHISGWPSGATGKVNAWSLAPNSNPSQGFAMGVVYGDGYYRIDGLQRGQRYGLIASGPGFSRNVVDYRRATSNDTFIPAACFWKTFNF